MLQMWQAEDYHGGHRLSEEQHTPYYSTRVRIGDITSPKDYIGLKDRTIEVTIGNTDKPVVIKNPNDVADVKSKDMAELINQAIDDTNKVAEQHGWKFLDQVKRDEA